MRGKTDMAVSSGKAQLSNVRTLYNMRNVMLAKQSVQSQAKKGTDVLQAIGEGEDEEDSDGSWDGPGPTMEHMGDMEALNEDV